MRWRVGAAQLNHPDDKDRVRGWTSNFPTSRPATDGSQTPWGLPLYCPGALNSMRTVSSPVFKSTDRTSPIPRA